MWKVCWQGCVYWFYAVECVNNEVWAQAHLPVATTWNAEALLGVPNDQICQKILWHHLCRLILLQGSAPLTFFGSIVETPKGMAVNWCSTFWLVINAVCTRSSRYKIYLFYTHAWGSPRAIWPVLAVIASLGSCSAVFVSDSLPSPVSSVLRLCLTSFSLLQTKQTQYIFKFACILPTPTSEIKFCLWLTTEWYKQNRQVGVSSCNASLCVSNLSCLHCLINKPQIQIKTTSNLNWWQLQVLENFIISGCCQYRTSGHWCRNNYSGKVAGEETV